MRYLETIRSFIIDNFLFKDGSQLRNSDSLLETGIIDSTGVLELIFFLETTCQISIAAAELTPDNMDSIDKIARFLERKCAMRETPVIPQSSEAQHVVRTGQA